MASAFWLIGDSSYSELVSIGSGSFSGNNLQERKGDNNYSVGVGECGGIAEFEADKGCL